MLEAWASFRERVALSNLCRPADVCAPIDLSGTEEQGNSYDHGVGNSLSYAKFSMQPGVSFHHLTDRINLEFVHVRSPVLAELFVEREATEGPCHSRSRNR